MAEKWYKNGIRFECTGCGNCCKSLDGSEACVYLNGDDIQKISAFLKISEPDFIDRDTEVRRGQRVLRDPDKDCIYLKDNRCLIYPVRPGQCRSWPFWQIALIPKNWETKVLASCPGVGKGKLHSLAEIEYQSEEVSPL